MAEYIEWQPQSDWDDHPDFPPEDWARECESNDTRLGYVDWVNAELEGAAND